MKKASWTLSWLLSLRAAIHHPDKASSMEKSASVEDYFVNLKVAQDTLTDPVKRFAYERFGPDMLKWQHCSSILDYLIVSLQVSLPLYIGSTLFLVILSVAGYLQWGRFVCSPNSHSFFADYWQTATQWRYLAIFSLFVLEYQTITRPYSPPLLSKILNPLLALTRHPPLLPFQLLTLAHKTTFTLFIAASQLAPFFQPPTNTALSSATPSIHESQQLTRLEQLAQATEMEAARLLALDMAPFVGDEQGVKELQGRVREWLVTNTIRADPEVRDAMGKALTKRRIGAPPGARPEWSCKAGGTASSYDVLNNI